ncbi:MAG: ATP-binding protein [Candidatus Omnitrophota bacterium]
MKNIGISEFINSPKVIIKTSIISDMRFLKNISKKIKNVLNSKEFDKGDIFDLQVAFEEVLRNAIVHGNKSNLSKRVIVEVELVGDTVKACIEDEGKGFDPEILPDPTHEENLLKENGRGVFLVKNLMDEVRYEAGGRIVTIVKTFKKSKP